MYLIALVLLIATICYAAVCGNSIQQFINLYDIPSLLIILLITIPMLLASGLFGDFKRAFRVIMTKKPAYTKLELERSLESVRLTIRLIIFSGMFGFLVGLINIFRYSPNTIDAQLLLINISVNLIIILYALFGCFILLPIKSKLKVLILNHSDEK